MHPLWQWQRAITNDCVWLTIAVGKKGGETTSALRQQGLISHPESRSATAASKAKSMSNSRVLSDKECTLPSTCLYGYPGTCTMDKSGLFFVVRRVKATASGSHPPIPGGGSQYCYGGIPIDKTAWTSKTKILSTTANQLRTPDPKHVAQWTEAIEKYKSTPQLSRQGTTSTWLTGRNVRDLESALSGYGSSPEYPWRNSVYALSRTWISVADRKSLLLALPNFVLRSPWVPLDNGLSIHDLVPPSWTENTLLDCYTRLVSRMNRQVHIPLVSTISGTGAFSPLDELDQSNAVAIVSTPPLISRDCELKPVAEALGPQCSDCHCCGSRSVSLCPMRCHQRHVDPIRPYGRGYTSRCLSTARSVCVLLP